MKIELDLKSVVIGFVLGTAPFWLMASDTADLSELKSTVIGAVTLVIGECVRRKFLNKQNG